MKIFVNGKEEPSAADWDSPLSFLKNLEAKTARDGGVISKLCLNGREIPLHTTEDFQIPDEAIETLEVETSTLSQIAEKNLNNAKNYLEKLVPGIDKASELFRSGSEQEANQFFRTVIDGFDWFSQVVDTLVLAFGVDPGKKSLAGQSIEDRKGRFMDLSKQLLQAHENQDWILVADLLEYEFSPFFREWQSLLPEIRGPEPETNH